MTILCRSKYILICSILLVLWLHEGFCRFNKMDKYVRSALRITDPEDEFVLDLLAKTNDTECAMTASSIKETYAYLRDQRKDRGKVISELKNECISHEDSIQMIEQIVKYKVNGIILKCCMVEAADLAAIIGSVLMESSQTAWLAVHHCNLNADILMKALNQKPQDAPNSVLDQESKILDTELSHDGGNRDNHITTTSASKNSWTSPLQVLDLSFNNFDSKGLRMVAITIGHSPSLSSLSLDGNSLDRGRVRTLVHALRRHQSVSYLSLSSCSLDNECMELISFCIKSNRNISHLDISNNKASAEGMDYLLDAIRKGGGKGLVYLDLSYNPLTDEAVNKLSKALAKNQLPNLKHLIIREVGATSASMVSLLKALRQDSVLETLDLSGNLLIPKKKKSSLYTSDGIIKCIASSKEFKNVANVFQIKPSSSSPTGTKPLIQNYKTKRIDVRIRKESTSSGVSKNKKISKSGATKSVVNAITVALSNAKHLKMLVLVKVGLTDAVYRGFKRKQLYNTSSSRVIRLELNDFT